MNERRVIQAEGKTLREAVEQACEALSVPKQLLAYRLCAEHFRFGADTVKIEAWPRETVEIDSVSHVKALAAGILERMHLQADVQVQANREDVHVSVEMPASEVAGGRLRDLLDSLQHVLNKALAREGLTQRVVVDKENYREQHDQGVRYVAQKVCEKVLKEGCVVTLKPMNAYDRRLVHLEVARYANLGSRSSGGRGQMKRVQVFPLGEDEQAS